MKHRSVHFGDNQLKRLERLAERTAIPASEHIRRAIDQYLESVDYRPKTTAAVRAAARDEQRRRLRD